MPDFFSPISELFSPKSGLFSSISELFAPKSKLFSPNSEKFARNSKFGTPVSEFFAPKSELFSRKSELRTAISEKFAPNSGKFTPVGVYEADETLRVSETSFLIGILEYAMFMNLDIECLAPVTERLFYQMTTYFIPIVSKNIKHYS
jgi:hypothetical protein